MAYDSNLGYDPDKDYSAAYAQLQLQMQQAEANLSRGLSYSGASMEDMGKYAQQLLTEREKKLTGMKAAGQDISAYAPNDVVAGWTGSAKNPGQYIYGGSPEQDYYNPYGEPMTENIAQGTGYSGVSSGGTGYSGVSSGGTDYSGNMTDFYSPVNQYNQNITNTQAQNAEWLKDQKGYYDSMFGNYQNQMEGLRDSSFNSYRDAILASVEKGRAAYETQKGTVNANADEASRQAYIIKKQGDKNIPQALAAMGLTGGMTESAYIQNNSAYGQNVNNVNMQRNQQLADIENAIVQMVYDGDISIAEAKAKIDELRAGDLNSLFGMQLDTGRWLEEMAYNKDNAAYQNNAIGAQLGLQAANYDSGEKFGYAGLAQGDRQFDSTMTYNYDSLNSDNAYKDKDLQYKYDSMNADNAYRDKALDVETDYNDRALAADTDYKMKSIKLDYDKLDQNDKQFWAELDQNLTQFNDELAYNRESLAADTEYKNKNLEMDWYFKGISAEQDERKLAQSIAESNASIKSIQFNDSLKSQLQNHNISVDNRDAALKALNSAVSNAADIYAATGDADYFKKALAKLGINVDIQPQENAGGSEKENDSKSGGVSSDKNVSFTDDTVQGIYDEYLNQYSGGKKITEEQIDQALIRLIQLGYKENSDIIMNFYREMQNLMI
jgi:hypothetical protein